MAAAWPGCLLLPSAAFAETFPDEGLTGNPNAFWPGTSEMPGSFFPMTPSNNNNNPIIVNSGTVPGAVYGGVAHGNVYNNNVFIYGGRIGSSTPSSGNVTGGWSFVGDVYDNRVEVTGGRVDGLVLGGWIQGGDDDSEARNNAVIVGGSAEIHNNIYGAYANSANKITGNIVTINGGSLIGSLQTITGGYVFSGAGVNPDVSENEVTLNGGALNKNVNIYGGRAINASSVTANTVNITGGDWTVTGIYGGEFAGTGSGAVTDNIVSIDGDSGSVTATIYGGRSGGSGSVSGNSVELGGSGIQVVGDVYGGWSRRGSATGNAVEVGYLAPGSALGNVYGGYVNTGGGDAFSGNQLQLIRGDAPIAAVRNFEEVHFYHSGAANIALLDTTATGSSAFGTTIYTESGDVTFDGLIIGTGGLGKADSGTLTLTRDGSAISNQVRVEDGNLQIGNGGTSGSLSASGGFDVWTGASLIYNQSDTVLMGDTITGGGALVQRGSGTLTFGNESTNTFTGGTWIENGTLSIANSNTLYSAANAGNTQSGYVTFGTVSGNNSGITNNNKKFTWLPGAGEAPPPTLVHTFRTAVGSGTSNTVELRSLPNTANGTGYLPLYLMGVNINEAGGAFYVASGTAMNLYANNLQMLCVDGAGDCNRANGAPNDLHVENGGTFKVFSEGDIFFESGMTGAGNLEITSNAAAGRTYLANDNAARTWNMGSVSVSGSAEKATLLVLERSDTSAVGRVRLDVANTFDIHGGDTNNTNNTFSEAYLAGDGIVEASSITVRDGASLIGLSRNDIGAATNPATLTLRSNDISLSNFALGAFVNAPGGVTGTNDSIQTSSSSLLNLDSANAVNISGNNAISISTLQGTAFHSGDYLLIRSTNGFNGIADEAALNNAFTVSLGGFALNQNPVTSPRGTFGLVFGDDTSPDAGANTGNDIWLTHGLESLHMDWTGGSATEPLAAIWRSGEHTLFRSFEEVGNVHETSFLPGDKVYVSGANTYNIDMPAIATKTGAPQIVVSGLVVGQNASGNSSGNGQYVFSGTGGILADSGSAIINANNDEVWDEKPATGKLEKYGGSTLIFDNDGGNFFTDGVDIYGGTVSIDNGQQLAVSTGENIVFMDNATLEARGLGTLNAPIEVGSSSVNADAVATLRADGDFTMASGVTGTGGLAKSGAGSFTLSGANEYDGDTTLDEGSLIVTGTLGADTGNNYTGEIATAANTRMVFNQTANQTLSGNLTGGGALVKEGSGALTLSGSDNTYSGITQLHGGTLAVTSQGRVSDVLEISGGTTFDNSANTDTRYIKRLDVLAPANWTGDMNFSAGDQAMNFWLPTTMGHRDGQMLLMTGDADVTDATVNVGVNGASSPLTIGNEVILIAANSVTGQTNLQANGRGMHGVTLRYDFEIETRPDELIAKLVGIGANDENKAFTVGNLTGVALVNQSADQVAGAGLAGAVWAARQGLGIFGNIEGGWSRYETGSHFDLSSVSLLTGISGGRDVGPGFLTMGLFMDYGTGDYDTYNSFAHAPSVRGSGDVWHIGAGAMGRLDFEDIAKGLYVEASLQSGRLHNEYTNNDIRDGTGRRAGYDYSTHYYGAHVGLGRVWQLDDLNSLDLYGKYFWMRQAGKSVTLTTGDPVEFEDADSSRLRLGARLNRRMNEQAVLSGGLAVEREFDGKGFATTNGYEIESPTLRGTTGIAEINLAITPSKTKPLHINLNLTGYAGRRDGATASAQVKWMF